MSSVAKLKNSPWALFLCVLSLVALISLPLSVSAKVYLAGPGPTSGDPVDSNDLGSGSSAGGSGSDDDIDDALSVSPPDTDPVLPLSFLFLRAIIVPGGTGPLPFQLLFIATDSTAPEGAHAR
ncbi:hypothetical protein DRQ50_12705 [bacterium]|nr:MAG: hypothetical protein DRQ50_12705 [bacterium]